MARTKIAVLGGGPASLTAVHYLTRTPELRRRYDVTVYQMGWRLGGKGASGRRRGDGPDDLNQIQEHGLHILFGFYQNFFRMMSEVYDELGRTPPAPMATWREAFVVDRYGVIEYDFEDRWAPIDLTFPMNRAVPGKGEALNSSCAYLSLFVQGGIEVVFGYRALYDLQAMVFPTTKQQWAESTGCPRQGRPDALVRLAAGLLTWALEIAHDLAVAFDARCGLLLKVCDAIRDLLWPLWKTIATLSRPLSLLVYGLDFFAALLRGVIVDGVLLEGGYSRIDRWDFAEWLCRHGMHEETIPSPPVRVIYDAAFSYVDGQSDDKRIAAGVAVRTLSRMGLTYKGGMYLKMQSGMGDTVFGPLYEVLKRRGVKFAFFHKVHEVRLAEQTNAVEEIVIDHQAPLRGDDPYAYEPLFDVAGLPCWPATPDYAQLRDPEKVEGVDLESYYSGYTGELRPLKRGRDFDQVLWGMPIQTVPFVGDALMKRSWRWRRMVEQVSAVETASFQVWMKRDLEGLGWTAPPPLLSLFVQPLNTWADMSQTLWSEGWTERHDAKSVHYFTGAQPDEMEALPPDPKDDPEFEARRYAAAKALALEFLERNFTTLLPDAVDPDNPPCVDWDLLVDPLNAEGVKRFDSQYWRSNCGPSERCTLALPDTNQHRIAPGDTGYANLTITGDWTDNGFYVACMEGTVMSGILAARAITGEDLDIIGEGIDEGLGFTLD